MSAAIDPHEPVIVAATVAAGHDGLAEVEVGLRYANGAVRNVSLPYETVGPALEQAGVTTLADLIGRPWTALTTTTFSPVPSHTNGAS